MLRLETQIKRRDLSTIIVPFADLKHLEQLYCYYNWFNMNGSFNRPNPPFLPSCSQAGANNTNTFDVLKYAIFWMLFDPQKPLSFC